MRIELPGEALVIRFRPTAPDRVLASAEKEFRRSQKYHVSVFAGVKTSDETDDDLLVRLLRASELSGIGADGNPNFQRAHAAELSDAGFAFYKDGYDGELPEHYSVDFGDSPGLPLVEAFLSCFGPVERRPA